MHPETAAAGEGGVLPCIAARIAGAARSFASVPGLQWLGIDKLGFRGLVLVLDLNSYQEQQG